MSKPANKEAALRQLYGELNKFGQNGEYEKALKAANKSTFALATRRASKQ